MFALVRYELDGKTGVIPVTNIRNFAPEDLMDFNSDINYDAFWAGDGSTEGGFYLAKILHLAGEYSRF